MQVVRVHAPMHHHFMLSPIRESPLREAVGDDDEDPLLLEPVKASLDFSMVSRPQLTVSVRVPLTHSLTDMHPYPSLPPFANFLQLDVAYNHHHRVGELSCSSPPSGEETTFLGHEGIGMQTVTEPQQVHRQSSPAISSSAMMMAGAGAADVEEGNNNNDREVGILVDEERSDPCVSLY